MNTYKVINICLIAFSVIAMLSMQFMQWVMFTVDKNVKMFQTRQAKIFIRWWIVLQFPVFGFLVVYRPINILFFLLILFLYSLGGIFYADKLETKNEQNK